MNKNHGRTRARFRATALPALVIGAILALSACTPSSAPEVSAAVLTEVDVPGTTAMSAAAIDLPEFGYTETEFYAAGVAHRYRGAVPDSLETAEQLEGDWPYLTRVLVRTPEPERFNGTLIVEWTNVTLGQDADFVFGEVHDEILREGYAYAVVSVQGVGVQRLTTWSAKRYGDLSVKADNIDPEGGGKLDPCFMGAESCVADPLSWDIMTQVAQALKDNSGENAPLPGLTVENVIATGQSQSAARLTIYYNTIQPLAGVFDGFVFWDRSGQLRDDLDTPGISVNSESFAPSFPAVTTSTSTRSWDVAGSSHGSLYVAEYMDAMMVRDESFSIPGGTLSFTQLVEGSCESLPPFSTVPAGLVVTAAVDSVREWITTGTEAAPSTNFTRDADDALVRDAAGQVEGGIRLAEFAAPTADIVAVNGETFPCSISGYHRFLTAEELTARYGTHAAYVDAVRAASQTAVEDGYLLPADAEATIAAAAGSDVAN